MIFIILYGIYDIVYHFLMYKYELLSNAFHSILNVKHFNFSAADQICHLRGCGCLFVCLRLQSGRAAEPGLLLSAALLRPCEAGHHRLDAAVPTRTPTQPGGSQRPGLTNQEALSGPPPPGPINRLHKGPRTKGTEFYLLLLREDNRRSTKTAAAL